MRQEIRPFSYDDVVARFKAARPRYQQLASYLSDWFMRTSHGMGIFAIVQSRAKTVDSFAEKIVRPGRNYQDPLRELSDLCGARVIVPTLDQVETLAKIIEREFVVDPRAAEDTQARLAFGEFGYLSRHYDLQLKHPPEIAGLDAEQRRALTELKFELQLRTIAQHAWADVNHDIGYKNEFTLPRRWKREWARAAALLEQCDQTFMTIKEALKTYESNYSAYMSQEELRVLGERLETLIGIDPENRNVMHKLIRVYMALDNATTQLVGVLERFGQKLDLHEPALRDVGVAVCQLNKPGTPAYGQGLERLRRAVDANPQDVDALCSFGGALRRQGDVDQAIACYRRAHHLDPTNPYPLSNYVAEELARRRDADVLDFFRSAIVLAAQRCRTQLEVKVNLPWAFYDLGMFSLYLREPEASVGYYARGIVDSPNDWMIQSANKGVTRLLEAGIPLEGAEHTDRLLKLGWWVRASDRERSASDWQPERGPVSLMRGPLLVLAGRCAGSDAADAAALAKLRELLDGYQGTIVSGGTNSGIARLAGDLQAASKGDALHTVGYIPAAVPGGIERWIDRRCAEHRRSTGRDFSILEPLTFWEDYFAGGGKPGDVRLIGFSGGATASGEFRIALALGAHVGIIQGSGRAADALLVDPLWKDHERLSVLSLSMDSLGGFLKGA